MTITLVLPNAPAYSETFFRSKISGLLESGHQVLLVTAATNQKFEGCTHLQHPKVFKNLLLQVVMMGVAFIGLLPYLKTVFRYISLEKKERTGWKRVIEKLYTNATLLKLKTDWLHYGFATMALDRELVAKAIGAQMAVSFRGYDIGIYPLKHSGCYDRLWNYVNRVHYISDDLYHKAIHLGLSTSVPKYKITPAINTQYFQTQQLNTMGTEKHWTFLTVGRLHWKKGFIDTLKALVLLKKEGINFTYKIIGDGPDYERIAFAAYQLGIKEQVFFLGKLNHDVVKEELNQAQIYLQYSIQEGFCNAVLEAQAMGKLVIVSDAEGLAENVLNQESGWVVPRLQPKKLAEKIIEIIRSPHLQRDQIVQQAVQRVKNEFNLQKQNDSFNQFYQKE